MNYYCKIRFIYDVNSKFKLANNIINIINRKTNPNQVLINACCDQIVRNIIFR